MRVLVWLVEDTWESAVAQTIATLPESAEITLLFVVDAEPEEVASGARAGLLGRRRGPPPPHEPPLSTISEDAARGLLSEAAAASAGPSPMSFVADAWSTRSSPPPRTPTCC